MEAFEDYIEDLAKEAEEEGKKHVAIQIAKRMIDIKMKDEEILKVTHLTKKELEELKTYGVDKILVEKYNDYNNVKEREKKGEKKLSFEKFLSKNLYNKKLEGIKLGKIKIIKEMVKNQISDADIIKVTRISEKELRHLKLQFMFMPELEVTVNDVIAEEKAKGMRYGVMRMAERMINEKINDKDILRFTCISKEELEELKLKGIDEMFKENEGVYKNLVEKLKKGEELTILEFSLRYALYKERVEGMKMGIEEVTKKIIKSKKMKDEEILILSFLTKGELEKLKIQIK